MTLRKYCAVMVAVFLSLAWAKISRGFTLIEDNFDVDYSTVDSSAPPISDVVFFRVYTDTNGLPAVQLTGAGDINWGGGALDGLLLPAVQFPPDPCDGLIGQTNGIIVVAMGDGSANTVIGEGNSFDFASTFGMSESDLVSLLPAVQAGGDTSALIGLLDKAYTGGLLPAMTGDSAEGTLVEFDAPTNVGSVNIIEVPEPGVIGLAGLALLLCGRGGVRRRCRN